MLFDLATATVCILLLFMILLFLFFKTDHRTGD